MRKIFTQGKIVYIVITLLFGLACFFLKDTYERFTNSSSDAQAAIVVLQNTKLDRAEFQKQCDINREEHESIRNGIKSDLKEQRDLLWKIYNSQQKQYKRQNNE